MKISVCDNCRKAHPSEYLMLDAKTEKYLCPTCYRNKRAKEEQGDNTPIYLVIIGILVLILFFCGMIMIGD